MPSIGQFKMILAPRPELAAFAAAPPLTDDERRRADTSAMLSMLWLHYMCGWQAADFSGDVFARQFKREGMTAADYLRLARESVDEQTSRAWMDARPYAEAKPETKQQGDDL